MIVIATVADHKIVAQVPQPSAFCPNIAASPDGEQVWFTLKDVGKAVAFSARPPFGILKVLETGPITNHVNFVRNANGQFAYVTVGGLNEVRVFRTQDFAKVATIPVGKLPHGIWPSGDGSRVYVGLENDDKLAVIDTLKNVLVATVPIGQAPQALAYVPDAVPSGDGMEGLVPLGKAGETAHLALVSVAKPGDMPTSVSLFDQGLVQVMQASVTSLVPRHAYVLALAASPDGSGTLQPLAAFTTNPAGGAIVNSIGPIRQLVDSMDSGQRKYLVVAEGVPGQVVPVVQIQAVRK